MPSGIEPDYKKLHDDLVVLFLRWKMLNDLFGNHSRLDLLNNTAGAFFADVQRLLNDAIISGIARLTDRAVVCRQPTLTLSALAERVRANGDTTLADALDLDVQNALYAVDNIRQFRHKLIAHRDRAVALGQSSVKVEYAEIRTALEHCSVVLNRVFGHYDGGAVGYEHTIPSLQSVSALLNALKRARTLTEMLESGEVPWERLDRG